MGKKFRRLLSADTLKGDQVYNLEGEHIGKIDDLMIDVIEGVVSYAVLSFGGVMGLGDKLFAIPWPALVVDEEKKRIVLNVDKETLKRAEGFDKNHWPDLSSEEVMQRYYAFYEVEPYWSEEDRGSGAGRRAA
jgi:sporulation protein YlmC with PRC-barrel domain